jgi:hypothetical protein
LRVESSKQRGLRLHATGCGIGEHKASTETESEPSGFECVAARCDVVDEVGLAERQRFAGERKVVLVWRDRAKGVLVSSALGLHGPCALNCFGYLRTLNVPGDVVRKLGVCVGVSGAVGNWNRPARAGD